MISPPKNHSTSFTTASTSPLFQNLPVQHAAAEIECGSATKNIYVFDLQAIKFNSILAFFFNCF
jgi:hypothetical protein